MLKKKKKRKKAWLLEVIIVKTCIIKFPAGMAGVVSLNEMKSWTFGNNFKMIFTLVLVGTKVGGACEFGRIARQN